MTDAPSSEVREGLDDDDGSMGLSAADPAATTTAVSGTTFSTAAATVAAAEGNAFLPGGGMASLGFSLGFRV